ncbi:MAG: sporulation protein YqfD [Lachnospiraceae bacterium]
MRADLQGFVRVKVSGDYVERFLALCVNRGFLLWEMEATDGYTCVNMLVEDFKACKDFVRKTGVKVAVVKRTGLPFFMSLLWKRSVFVVGAIAFIVSIYISSRVLWHIELNGNYSISSDMFYTFLEEQGVYKGMWISTLDIEELEKEIRKEFDLVTWTSGKMDGTILMLDIKENEKSTIDSSEDTSFTKDSATGLYATFSGTIYSIYTRKGIPLVKAMQEVEKGELLVDGRVPIYLEDTTVGAYQFYDVDADILIDTQVEVEFSLSNVYIERIYTGREKQGLYVYLFDKIYPLTWNLTQYAYKETYLEQIKGISWDEGTISVGKYYAKEYQGLEKSYTQEQAEEILEEYLDKKISELEEKGVQILDKNVTIESSIGKWVLQGVLEVRMPAVEKLPMILEDVDDREGI